MITAATVPASAEPVIQQLGGGAAERLSEALRVLASDTGNIYALVAAGNAALELNDESAAYGFYARAAAIAPRDPQVNAGLGRVFVRLERADEALARFAQAQAAGADVRGFAADRGLAQDLRGDFLSAQADYRLVGGAAGADEVVRRLALSQAIGGDTRGGLATLAPLLSRFDASAFRAQAFILAMGGDAAAARSIAQARMSPGMAGLFDRFFARLPTLNPAERARAVHFGDMPAPGQSYASVRPGGTRPGGGRGGGQALAANTTPPPRAVTRARGGALIPRGAALGRSGQTRRPGPADLSPWERMADRRRAAAVAPARNPPPPPPPPPLPARITLVLPTPAPAAPVVVPVDETVDEPVAVAVEQRSEPVVIASVADTALRQVATPSAPDASAVQRVDPDPSPFGVAVPTPDLQPGDQIITPDGPATSVPLAFARPLDPLPESLLPPGALPTESPSPGFATAGSRIVSAATPSEVALFEAGPGGLQGAVPSALSVPPTPATPSEVARFEAGPGGGQGAVPSAVSVRPSPATPDEVAQFEAGPGASQRVLPSASAVRPSPAPAGSEPSSITPSAEPETAPFKVAVTTPTRAPPAPFARATVRPPAAKPIATPPVPTRKTAAIPTTAGAKGQVAPTPAKAADAKAKTAAGTVKPKPKVVPVAERYWFQIATGRDATALAADFKRLQKKHDLLAKLDGVTSDFGARRRLVVGPFASLGAAKAFEVKARTAGLDGYVWVSPEGFEVDPLPGS